MVYQIDILSIDEHSDLESFPEIKSIVFTYDWSKKSLFSNYESWCYINTTII